MRAPSFKMNPVSPTPPATPASAPVEPPPATPAGADEASADEESSDEESSGEETDSGVVATDDDPCDHLPDLSDIEVTCDCSVMCDHIQKQLPEGRTDPELLWIRLQWEKLPVSAAKTALFRLLLTELPNRESEHDPLSPARLFQRDLTNTELEELAAVNVDVQACIASRIAHHPHSVDALMSAMPHGEERHEVLSHMLQSLARMRRKEDMERVMAAFMDETVALLVLYECYRNNFVEMVPVLSKTPQLLGLLKSGEANRILTGWVASHGCECRAEMHAFIGQHWKNLDKIQLVNSCDLCAMSKRRRVDAEL